LQDDFSTNGDFVVFWGSPIITYLKSQLDAPICIGGVIAERNILSPLCLIVQTSPLNLALASGNRNRFCTQKLHA
jgi:hypothetical protein